MKTKSATAYTEEFIINEMKQDWWIGKQNQLLFMWSTIYEGILNSEGNTNTVLYDWLDDENESRSNEYWKALNEINASYERYKQWYKPYMDTLSAEYKRQSDEYEKQSAEYKRQSAEYKRQSAEALNSSLENIAWFYNRYKKDPNSIPDEELNQWKEKWKQVIQGCKEDDIDYKAKLSKEMLEFYGEK